MIVRYISVHLLLLLLTLKAQAIMRCGRQQAQKKNVFINRP